MFAHLGDVDGINPAAVEEVKFGVRAVAAVAKGEAAAVTFREGIARHFTVAGGDHETILEDRFVIPTSHREMARDAFPERNGCGFTFGDGCHGSDTKFNLFNSSRIDAINITEVREHGEGE